MLTKLMLTKLMLTKLMLTKLMLTKLMLTKLMLTKLMLTKLMLTKLMLTKLMLTPQNMLRAALSPPPFSPLPSPSSPLHSPSSPCQAGTPRAPSASAPAPAPASASISRSDGVVFSPSLSAAGDEGVHDTCLALMHLARFHGIRRALLTLRIVPLLVDVAKVSS